MTDLWRQVWERKGQIPELPENRTELILTLAAAGGYDMPCSKMSVEDVESTGNGIGKLLGITNKSKVLDIGCGTGVTIFVMQETPSVIYGIDYSSSLIDIARKLLPEGNFTCCEADAFSVPDSYFDCIISHGPFMYFPDYEYAYDVLGKMVAALVPGGSGFILNIPDLDTEDACEQVRRKNLTKEEYEKKYGNHKHMHFSKEQFSQWFDNNGCVSSLEPHPCANYGYRDYRFNVLFTKQIA